MPKEKGIQKMNVRLLRRVAKHIAEEPRRLDMYKIAAKTSTGQTDTPPCGTVGCIAGWACLLSGSSVHGSSWSKGMKLLGLTNEQAFRLFDYPIGCSGDGWPARFGQRFINAKTSRGEASAAIARIWHFIKTKGAE